MTEQFAGQTALVTGGAGDIGSAIAERLARGGARVIVADRDAGGAAKTADAIAGWGGEAVAVACDQTDPAAVAELFGDVVGERLDVCIANAGFGRFASVLEQDLTGWLAHIDINLTGTFLVCQAAARTMAAAGRGSIVVNASTAALRSTALFGAYASSKAAVEMLARTMADELGPHGIRVNTVCPGVIDTGMTRDLLSQRDGRMRTVIESETPLGRAGRPDDVAAAVAFLASDEARYITGVALLVDGGQTLRGFPRWFGNEHRDGQGIRWRLLPDFYAADRRP